MANVLVMANETLGGASLIEALRERHQEGDARFFLVVPQSRPRHGNVIYDEAVRDAAQVRVDLARQFLGGEGIDVEGEIGDADPFAAAMDATGLHGIDEVIVSTLPASRSGWLRRDLIERIADASQLPVKHVVTDVDAEGIPFTVTLVVANQTATSEQLVARLGEKAAESDDPNLFIIVMPLADGSGAAAAEGRGRLQETLRAMRAADLVCAGMIGDPDPHTAALNALQTFQVSDVVVSTFPPSRSAWLRGDVVERLDDAVAVPVEHFMADDRAGDRAQA